MAAGLGFKDFTTGEVLTAADVDGYLMQGVWVFASAAARDAAVTSPQEGNFAYLKDTNVTTYYTGSAWANLDTTGMTNPMTTTGDTIYSSSGSTPARLAIGSTGNVLTVAGGVPTWAAPSAGGGMTLLSTTTLSGASTTISSISGAYKNLYFVMSGVTRSTAGVTGIRFNANSGSVYFRLIRNWLPASSISSSSTTETLLEIPWAYGADAANADNIAFMTIHNYSSSTTYKLTDALSYQLRNSPSEKYMEENRGVFESNTAITSIVFSASSGTFSTGTVLLYGVS